MESILSQSWQNFEIILLDDASTDDSVRILENYRGHPLVKRIEVNIQNSGSPMKQWLNGVSMAQTEWVYIAESDDTCHPQLFESLAPQFANPKLVAALTEVLYINENEEPIFHFPTIGEQLCQGTDFVNRYMLTNCYVCNSGMAAFRKSAVPVPGEWNQKLSYSPDYYFWIFLLSQGMVYTNGRAMAYFRKHPNEFTHGKWGSLLDHADHAAMLGLLLKQHYLTPNQVRRTLKHKLVGLNTQRRGIDAQVYNQYLRIWKSLAKEVDISIGDWELEWAALRAKIAHNFR